MRETDSYRRPRLVNGLLTGAAVAGALMCAPDSARAQTAVPSATQGGAPPTDTPPGTAMSPPPAQSDATPEANGPNADIVVTATRRNETVTKLPFNISAYSGEQFARANITNVAALTQQVPNFIIEDRGARSSAASIPIIRGVNASVAAVNAARYFQSPVGFYLGNAPVTGAFPLFDIERVEVLRGPQGTLYGAGALSGAVRIVPQQPRFDAASGLVTASVGALAHSGRQSYVFGSVLNLPLADNLAIRVNARHEYSAGFIDQHDIFKRAGDDYKAGVPILANPADVAGSRGVYFDRADVDDARTTSFRAALRWEPTPQLAIGASYDHSQVKGTGAPIDNPTFAGGPSPIDPRVTLRPTRAYERSLAMLEPYDRTSELAALDASYDLGFATVATTLTYGRTAGDTLADSTQNLLGAATGAYYTGIPANPRTVIPVDNTDRDRSFTQELRLVSAPGGSLDYILGAFFQQQARTIGLVVLVPGADTYSAAAGGGSTVPIALGGTFVPLFPDGSSYIQDTRQTFRDYSAYGELTWHITPRWQVTGGARVFRQTFKSDFSQNSSLFLFELTSSNANSVTSQIFKANTSYQFDDRNQVYATFSQGFRRGGANAFPTEGFVLEPKELLFYEPDRTNNIEAGFKGRVAGVTYAVDAFYIDWRNPQIDLSTPFNLTPVVVNARGAVSKGVEIELSGPVLFDGFSFNLGAAYSRARLSEDFGLPAGLSGQVIPDAIRGRKGDRLPGAPDVSASGTINYKADFGGRAAITYSFGADYRSATYTQLGDGSGGSPTRRAAGYALLRASISAQRDGWTLDLYGSNLADKRAVLSPNNRSLTSIQMLGDWGNAFAIVRPREIGLRLTRSF